MNIIGIGTDIVSIARIQRIWERFELAFARRILSSRELGELSRAKNKVGFLAKRYAAKEAVAKALGTGFQPKGIRLTEIVVCNDPLGKPFLCFEGNTKAEMEKKHVLESHLSLSDEQEFAVAFVILMGHLKKEPQ